MGGELPRTADALIRDLTRRIGFLERNAHPMRTKNWIISERPTGVLVARHVPTGTETVIASPPP